MERTNFIKERGQSLVLLALLLVGLIAMLGLAMDGGNFLSQRRAAQNAADAGALAGADLLCEAAGDPAVVGDVIYTANYMATINNEADSANVSYSLDPENLSVTVNTYIPHDTYFAHFLSSSLAEVTADATATAGCFGACFSEGVLPVAWSCRPPASGEVPPYPPPDPPPDPPPPEYGGDCTHEWVTMPRLDEILDGFEDGVPADNCDSSGFCRELYIVMDSVSYQGDFYCITDENPDGELYCDLDDDGEGDWIGSGGRSWLDLDGSQAEDDCESKGEGAAELIWWVEHGFADENDQPCRLINHSWIPAQTGVATSIFRDVSYRTGDIVIVPVFNDFCDGDPQTDPACTSPPDPFEPKWHSQDVIFPLNAADPMYFHIIDFTPFYISCVNLNQHDACPGIEKAKELNPGVLGPNTKSIEGYFLTGYTPGLGGRCEGIGSGGYTLYLDH